MFDFTDFEEWLFYQQLKDQVEIEREQLKNISYVRGITRQDNGTLS